MLRLTKGAFVNVVIPKKEAETFAVRMKTDEYWDQERGYKDGVHVVISALLSPAAMVREEFPSLIANVFKETLPDLDALGISAPDQKRVRAGVAGLGASALRGAMANLAGGKWGLAQFAWIPRAIEFGLGEEFAQAFRELVADHRAGPRKGTLLATRPRGAYRWIGPSLEATPLPWSAWHGQDIRGRDPCPTACGRR